MSNNTPICIVEDDGWQTLLPLTWLHSPVEFLFGANTILHRIQRAFPDRDIVFNGRPWIAPVMEERYGLVPPQPDSRVLFINARLMDVELVRDATLHIDGDFALWNSNTFIAARCMVSHQNMNSELLPGNIREMKIPGVDSEARTIDRWWDAIYRQAEFLDRDSIIFAQNRDEFECPDIPGFMLQKESIFISDSASVDPGVVIDARNGPVIIDHEAHVGSGAVLVGPMYVGPHCLIKPLAHIGPEVSLGPFSKVGGEVARSIFLGYANKQHDGFLGHAYISNWVNLGAGTTNSNLKNTYGHVQVWVSDGFEDSGKTFVGCVIGDHSKTAIGTTLNTGTVIGISCNVFEHGFPPKFVPSFSWGNSGIYDLEKALSTAEQIMLRRNKELTPKERELMKTVWGKTKRIGD